MADMRPYDHLANPRDHPRQHLLGETVDPETAAQNAMQNTDLILHIRRLSPNDAEVCGPADFLKHILENARLAGSPSALRMHYGKPRRRN